MHSKASPQDMLEPFEIMRLEAMQDSSARNDVEVD
jgi:hypothetical protein